MEMGSITKKDNAMNQTKNTTLNTLGLRHTTQRSLIMEIIREGHGHLDADEIYRRARAKQPRISLSTVYRTLKALKEPGVIEELHLDDTHHHYEIRSNIKHHHLVCLECGKVVEFEYPIARYVRRNISEAKDFDIADIDLCIKGYCAHCRTQKQ